jgi:hypothetical protein
MLRRLHRFHFISSIGTATLMFGVVVTSAVACSSGGSKNGGAPIPDSSIDDSSTLDVGHNDGFSPDGSDIGFDGACATAQYAAKQDPAAMLFILDASNPMTGPKWSAAGLAIVTAIDLDGFDGISLGLLASPSSTTDGAPCFPGFPVMCGNPAVPQVAMANAGTDKSSAPTGVRHNIYSWLSANYPDKDTSSGSGTPLYDALSEAYKFIRLVSVPGKRIVTFVVNGAASCASIDKRPGYLDSNSCPDWEEPDTLIALIKAAHDDPTAPVLTFVIGVPGADTDGSDPLTQPPYHLKRALSAYALAGSRETTPAGCDGAWSQTGLNPTVPCHYDMTSGSLDAKALADNLAHIRGSALGCVFDLPTPTDGSTIDKNKVNVEIDNSGPPPTTDALKRRSDPSDTCATDGCWDYTSDGKIQLLGKACDEAKSLTDGKVQIIVGCATAIK